MKCMCGFVCCLRTSDQPCVESTSSKNVCVLSPYVGDETNC